MLTSSNGPLLVLGSGNASLIPELHVGNKGNSENIVYTETERSRSYLLSSVEFKVNPFLSRLSGRDSVRAGEGSTTWDSGCSGFLKNLDRISPESLFCVVFKSLRPGTLQSVYRIQQLDIYISVSKFTGRMIKYAYIFLRNNKNGLGLS